MPLSAAAARNSQSILSHTTLQQTKGTTQYKEATIVPKPYASPVWPCVPQPKNMWSERISAYTHKGTVKTPAWRQCLMESARLFLGFGICVKLGVGKPPSACQIWPKAWVRCNCVNKVLLKHGHFTCLRLVCGHFHTNMVAMKSCNRDGRAHRVERVY